MNDAITLLSTPPPTFAESAVASILLDQYGLQGTLNVLDSERDQNFLVETESHKSFVFKIANPAEATGVTEFQVAALLHIEKKVPELRVPRVVPALSGNTSVTMADENDRKHAARVLTWLAGIPLSSAEPKPDIAAKLGSFLARLGKALADFEHPSSDHVLLWDLSHAGQLALFLDNIDDNSLRKICQQRLHRFEEHTKNALDKLRSQVIYNDLHSSNLLVDPRDPETITGIIDFGDLVKSPLVVDIAVAAAYLCEDGNDPLTGMFNFLRGYSQIRPLLTEEIELLYELIMLRNTMTIIMSHWRTAQNPNNRKYLLRSESLARSTINIMTGIGQNKVTDLFLRACRH